MSPQAILFDFDGTLVQTRECSWRIFSQVNEKFGLGVDTQEAYFALLDGNIYDSLRKLCESEAEAQRVNRYFLDRLKSDYDPPFVPGMVDVIKTMAGAASLAVVSSNSMETIRRILTNAGLEHCFSHVFGGDIARDKRECVQRFLSDASYLVNRACVPEYAEGERPNGPSKNQVVLVTDTSGDVLHARECGVRAVGVAWGMHSERKLQSAGAEFVAVWPQELISYFFPDGTRQNALPTTLDTAACDCGCDGSGEACDCDHSGPKQANEIRRARALAAADGLRARLEKDRSPAVDTTPDAPTPVDRLLLASLSRLHKTRSFSKNNMESMS